MQQENRSSELVTIGNNTELSFHQLQDIYNALTGKTETISKQFDRPYLIGFGDIEQLHARIYQCCTSYGAKVKNENISIFHINGQKETFSSFDRFRLYNKTNTSPVENVHIEYHFLIIPSGTTTPKKYSIKIDLPSRMGLVAKDPDFAIGSLNIFHMFSRLPARFQIEFVDYAAARHFQTQFEEWFDALGFSIERKWLTKLQGSSHWMRMAFPVISIGVLFCSLAFYSSRLQVVDFNNAELFRHICIVGFLTSVLWLISTIAGRATERAVDRIQPISYVSLNRGDEKCREKLEKLNFRNAVLTIGGLLVAFGINITAAKVIEWWL